jgi:hypothetical protein
LGGRITGLEMMVTQRALSEMVSMGSEKDGMSVASG